jgi:predicted AAA+ superfamily ATPase
VVYINRQIEKKLTDIVKYFPCVVVTGARQVGKSTTLKNLFPTHAYLSLDLPSDAEQANRDPESLFKRFAPPLIIDEVQYAPGLFRHLKILIDQQRHSMGRFILTGSQKFTLMKEVSDSLAGRAALINMENLSISELNLSPQTDWFAALHRGFYPELWREPGIPLTTFYSSYVAAYLERDVRQVINVQSLRDFERFLRACALRSGQLLNMSELGRDVGIKSQTARDWLSVLEATNQVTLLEPYFENVGKRFVKSPKLFLNDPGMLCFLLGLEETTLAATPLIGLIWETMICAEFRKAHSLNERPATLWFYRDEQGREIDFLEVVDGKFSLSEAKWSNGTDRRWTDNILEVSEILSRSRTMESGSHRVFSRVPQPLDSNGVKVLHPAHYFLRNGQQLNSSQS